MRFLLGLVLILLLAAGGAYVVAGRMAGPPIQIIKPEKVVGRLVPARGRRRRRPARVSKRWTIVLEQNGKQFPLFSLADQKGAQVKQDGAGQAGDQPRDRQAVGARAAVGQRGRHRHRARARWSTASARSPRPRAHDFKVRLERPRVSVVSTHHYINHGGVRDGRLPRHAGRRDVGRGRRRRRVSRLSGDGRRRSTASRSPIPRCASRSSRCCTIRI